ncbi:MAG: response regulator [Pseudomonadota bacterium]
MKRCVVFDNAPIIRKVAKRILSDDDMVVIEAESGRDMLAKAEFDMPDFFLIDAGVRDMELNDVIATIRRMKAKVRPFIIVSMHELDIVLMARAKRVGADELLLKPFDRKMLISQFEDFERRALEEAAAAAA